ncbi:MAG TPA: hypothetical protein VNW54_09885 [Granulicella sp.]|jgi:hypothetical protein|nr:hypothetical protein [Granulicella sp.]
MDSVRFGRALGFGARSAAKALVTAVDAASTPNPSPSRSQRPAPKSSPSPAATAPNPASPRPIPTPPASRPLETAACTATRAAAQVQQTRAGVVRGGKRFGTSVWRPLVKLSGVLWLELTGSFFALFALFAGQSTWTHRADLHQTALNHTAHQHLLVSGGVTLLFTYFSVSSFLKARRRGRAS